MPGKSSNPDFTVIIPTYNESLNIVNIVKELRFLYPNTNLLIMDDDSPDGTSSVVKDAYPDEPQIEVVVRKNQIRGLSASVIDGIFHCRTKFFIVMDADFQHPPSYVQAIMTTLQEESDLCIAIRKNRNALGTKRKFFSNSAEFLSKFYLKFIGKQSSHDNMSGFFGGRTDIVAYLLKENYEKLEITGFKILFDILKFVPDDLSLREVEFVFGTREMGDSKIGSKIVSSILRQCGFFGKILARMYQKFVEWLR